MTSSFSLEIYPIMDLLKDNAVKNPDFLKHLKHVIESYRNAEENHSVFIDILPLIINRFIRIYDDNFSLSETTEDEFIIIIMRDNLQTSFDLAENCQEILNLFCEQQMIYLTDIKHILKQLLNCVLLFLKHWECSSEHYKELFYEDIETSLTLNEDEENAQELADVLLKISDMSVHFFNLDVKLVVCTWKSFGTIATKYSDLLQVSLDIAIPIQCLTKIIYKIFQSINSDSEETGKGPIKILSFLMKVLYKVSDIFYQKLDIFSKELVLLLVEIFNMSESTALNYHLQDEVYKNLEVFLLHLIIGESAFKKELCDITNFSDVKNKPVGILNLFSKILKISCKQSEDCSNITAKLLEVVFIILPNAYAELILEDNSLYYELIINMSAGILLQDKTGFSISILTKNIVNTDPVCALLALEVFTLVSRNISENEAFILLINLLYSLNDLHCGSFTSQPDMLYLKCLLFRMFHALSDTSRDQVIKQFCTIRYKQVWKYLDFSLLNFNQISQLMKPTIENANTSINNFSSEFTKDSFMCIADCLELLSTAVVPPNVPEITNIISFVNTFWSLDLNQSYIAGNHCLQYFQKKICGITTSLLKTHILNPQLVFRQMIKISSNKNYWTIVYKIIDGLLYSTSSTCVNDSYNQQLMKNISDIISLILRDTTDNIIKHHYFEMFKNLNRTHRDILNTFLDILNSNVAHNIYQNIENVTIHPRTKERNTFQHKCLIWNQGAIMDNINPKIKKPKIEETSTKPVNSSQLFSANKENNYASVTTMDLDQEESSASEVIDRLKDEVKCLLRICKTEKLSVKNVSDLRILTSKINSII
ncbi:uncharacterized protein LOC143195183 isoform X2 [Rhynchophorus ferrugineus]|uniref:uncharacterized protein LOC143195183 isoform X2 n=1 Tax=Rhynchophorus ferrugineus TaxID=354439 RepID=UPI003FCCEC05